MTDKEKLEKLKKLADAMYYAAQHLTTDASRLHKAMNEYHQFIIHECKEEPVNNDFEMALAEMIYKAQTSVVEPLVIAAQWKDELIKLAKSEEPVSEDLEEAASRYAKEEYSRKNPATLPDKCIGCYAPIMYAFKAGAQWQKEQMMSKAVDALVHTFDNGYIRVGTQLLENNKYGLKVGDKVKVIVIKED